MEALDEPTSGGVIIELTAIRPTVELCLPTLEGTGYQRNRQPYELFLRA